MYVYNSPPEASVYLQCARADVNIYICLKLSVSFDGKTARRNDLTVTYDWVSFILFERRRGMGDRNTRRYLLRGVASRRT